MFQTNLNIIILYVQTKVLEKYLCEHTLGCGIIDVISLKILLVNQIILFLLNNQYLGSLNKLSMPLILE